MKLNIFKLLHERAQLYPEKASKNAPTVVQKCSKSDSKVVPEGSQEGPREKSGPSSTKKHDWLEIGQKCTAQKVPF